MVRVGLCFLFNIPGAPDCQAQLAFFLGLKYDPTDKENYSLYLFVAMFLGCTSTGRVGLCFLWFYVQELPKAQPAVVLVLKHLRRQGNSLKSHPTDREKLGIEPATPGLQDKTKTFCGFSMDRNQYWAGRVHDLCFYHMTGTPEGSTESGFMEKPGIEPAIPKFTRHSAYPLHHGGLVYPTIHYTLYRSSYIKNI